MINEVFGTYDTIDMGAYYFGTTHVMNYVKRRADGQ